MPETRSIYCCACATDVMARLTNGAEIYPHRQDLAALPFWRCDACRNYVGCHHKTRTPTEPIGCIPDQPMRKARGHIHAILDPIWKGKRLSRNHIYARLTEKLGRQYHTGELRTLEEARMIYRAVQAIEKELTCRIT
jgi:hypothetical protein